MPQDRSVGLKKGREPDGLQIRRIAFDVLLCFEKSGATRLKADAGLEARVAGLALSAQERGFVHALVMGCLRHWCRLDDWILQLSQRKLKSLQPAVRVLLRMGLFQLYGLRQVPPYAALDTTVSLARLLKLPPKVVGFLNALLREAQRRLEGEGFTVPNFETEPVRHLLLVYGWPEALSEMLLKAYASSEVLNMAEAAQHPAPLALRVNTLKCSLEAFRQAVEQQGLRLEVVQPDLAEALLVPDWSGPVQALPGYDEGWFYVQDPASIQVACDIGPNPGERVLDLCAAPGSKTTHLAALMENTGTITAIEPKLQRLGLLSENLQRLGVTNVQAVQADALQWTTDDLYDRVLVDAPCSGSGTLRRHPEILLQFRKPASLEEATALQLALLEKGFYCLKPGGVLVYSTCSILPAENRELIQRFLAQHTDASLEMERQSLITPVSDGFYVARIQKHL